MESAASRTPSLTEVVSYRLENGLRVVVTEDHSVPIVTTMLWYGVGSRQEPSGATGIAHFLEHMMFRGTHTRPDGSIDQLTTANGGHNNAFTSYDHTAYFFSFSSDRWRIALELESDRMHQLALDRESLETERQVILEEISMTRDNPWEPLRQAADAAAFPEHPYGRPVIGLAEDVAAISADQMHRFYQQHYCPEQSVLAVAGDVLPDQAIEHIHETFGRVGPGISNGSESTSQAAAPKRESGGIIAVADRPGQVSRLLIALPAPPVSHPDACVHHLLDNLLAGGKLSRLHRRLVEEEQVASMVATDFEETLYPYHLFLRAELTPNRTCRQAIELVLEELGRLGREPVPAAELERARHLSLVQFLQDLETTYDRAFRAGLFELLGRLDAWQAYVDRLNAVDPDQLMEAARLYANPNHAWIAYAETPASGSPRNVRPKWS